MAIKEGSERPSRGLIPAGGGNVWHCQDGKGGEGDDFDCRGVAMERTDIAVVAADDLTRDRSVSLRRILGPC